LKFTEGLIRTGKLNRLRRCLSSMPITKRSFAGSIMKSRIASGRCSRRINWLTLARERPRWRAISAWFGFAKSAEFSRELLGKKEGVHPNSRRRYSYHLCRHKLQSPVLVARIERRLFHQKPAVFGSSMVKVGQPTSFLKNRSERDSSPRAEVVSKAVSAPGISSVISPRRPAGNPFKFPIHVLPQPTRFSHRLMPLSRRTEIRFGRVHGRVFSPLST
jgi:hypothetical protein